MAGLVAAAEATERGARVVVQEKGNRPGGSMLLSSGVVWRHRQLEDFRRECPGGAPELQRLVHERLDGDLAWLEGLGARVVARSTGNRADGRSTVRHPLVDRGACEARARAPARRATATSFPKARPWCSRPAASRPTATSCVTGSRPRPTASSSAPRHGAPATGSRSVAPREPPRRRGWPSSTGATCRRRRRGSTRPSSSRWRSCTPTTPSSRAAARGTSPGPGPRSTSSSGRLAGRVPGRRTASLLHGSRSG